MRIAALTFFLVLFRIIPVGSHGNGDFAEVSAKVYSERIESFYSSVFNSLRSESSLPGYEVFKAAITGYYNLRESQAIRNNLLTIIDFSISSRFERMWIIDMNAMKVIHTSLVAHGRNSGDEFATRFSNDPASYQSSLGFYLTGETYTGKNGLSLYLDGVEPGINDNARMRAIVMHGADYVSEDFINRFGRLGRSFGCPSIPLKDHEEIIKLLAGKSCLYIHYPDTKYYQTSGLASNTAVVNRLSDLMHESPDALNTY